MRYWPVSDQQHMTVRAAELSCHDMLPSSRNKRSKQASAIKSILRRFLVSWNTGALSVSLQVAVCQWVTTSRSSPRHSKWFKKSFFAIFSCFCRIPMHWASKRRLFSWVLMITSHKMEMHKLTQQVSFFCKQVSIFLIPFRAFWTFSSLEWCGPPSAFEDDTILSISFLRRLIQAFSLARALLALADNSPSATEFTMNIISLRRHDDSRSMTRAFSEYIVSDDSTVSFNTVQQFNLYNLMTPDELPKHISFSQEFHTRNKVASSLATTLALWIETMSPNLLSHANGFVSQPRLGLKHTSDPQLHLLQVRTCSPLVKRHQEMREIPLTCTCGRRGQAQGSS